MTHIFSSGKLVCMLSFILPLIFAANASTTCKVNWETGTATLKNGVCTVTKEVAKGDDSPVLIDLATFKKLKPNQNIFFKIKSPNLDHIFGFEFRLKVGDQTFPYTMPLMKDRQSSIIQDNTYRYYSLGLQHFGLKEPVKNSTFQIFVAPTQKGPINFSVADLKVSDHPFSKGRVSLTIDDGYKSVFPIAKAWAQMGLKGDLFLISEGLKDQTMYMPKSKIVELESLGWHLQTHHEKPFVDVHCDDFAPFIQKATKSLKSEFPKGYFDIVAYPLGKYDEQILSDVAKINMAGRIAIGGLETLPPADRYLIRAINVTPELSPEELFEMAKTAVDQGHWAVFMFHYFANKPGNDLTYGNAQALKLGEYLKAIKESVVPMRDVITSLPYDLSYLSKNSSLNSEEKPSATPKNQN
jgi:hypothetical protein